MTKLNIEMENGSGQTEVFIEQNYIGGITDDNVVLLSKWWADPSKKPIFADSFGAALGVLVDHYLAVEAER